MSEGQSNAPNYRILISRFSASGQWDRVLETARDWIAADPENARAHLAAGQALLNLKRYPEADPFLRRALAGEPQNSVAHRFISIAHFHGGRFKEADEAIQKAISLSPEDHYNWYHLAWMFYRQGDRASARKYAERARQLAPRDADVVNLLALCAPSGGAASEQKLRQYKEALELDPENAEVHNNIGAYHLNVTRDFVAAEECFRRALFFDPALKTARANLFLAIKHRDRVYQVICVPRDGLLQGFSMMRRARKKGFLVYLLLLPVWILAFRFLLAALILWCLLIWPMGKVYEFLTIGDIRAQAGEVGSRRGGFLGYRRWPVRVRLSIFAVCLVSFWAALDWVYFYGESSTARSDTAVMLGGIGIVTVLRIFVFVQLPAMIERKRARNLSRLRTRRMAGILETETDGR
jgi:tetratricopeptide (TPR) repeat protein